MRKKFNRVAVASSDNYSSSRKAHYNYLVEQHNNNSVALIAISSRVTEADELHQFDLFIQRQITSFKERRIS